MHRNIDTENDKMRRLFFGMIIAATSSMAVADGLNGIWKTAADDDGGYLSKLHLKGDVLDVEGCISFICIGQDWTRVK